MQPDSNIDHMLASLWYVTDPLYGRHLYSMSFCFKASPSIIQKRPPILLNKLLDLGHIGGRNTTINQIDNYFVRVPYYFPSNETMDTPVTTAWIIVLWYRTSNVTFFGFLSSYVPWKLFDVVT